MHFTLQVFSYWGAVVWRTQCQCVVNSGWKCHLCHEAWTTMQRKLIRIELTKCRMNIAEVQRSGSICRRIQPPIRNTTRSPSPQPECCFTRTVQAIGLYSFSCMLVYLFSMMKYVDKAYKRTHTVCLPVELFCFALSFSTRIRSNQYFCHLNYTVLDVGCRYRETCSALSWYGNTTFRTIEASRRPPRAMQPIERLEHF